MGIDIEMEKGRCEIFLKYNKRIFVKTRQGDFHFCDILTVGEDFLYVQDFEGKRAGEKSSILWLDIERIAEYREVDQNV